MEVTKLFGVVLLLCAPSFVGAQIVGPIDNGAISVTASDARYVDVAGDTMTGDLVMDGSSITFTNPGSIENPNYVQFNTDFADGTSEGRLQWNVDDGTLEIGMPGGNVNLQLGQETLIRVKNDSGVTITNGSLVYQTGVADHRPEVGLADSRIALSCSNFLGVATEDIANNQTGYVVIQGYARGIDYSGFTLGDEVYVSTTSGVAAANPPSEGCIMPIGTIVRAAEDGVILVRISRVPDQIRVSSVTASEFYGDGSNLTGLATDGELAAVAASTGTLTEDLATEISDREIADAALAVSTGAIASDLSDEILRATARENEIGASTGTIQSSLDAVILSTAPLANASDWDTAYGWGDHATAGYVERAGDTMTGQLTTASTITVQGNAFSVGTDTFTVKEGVTRVGPNVISGMDFTVTGKTVRTGGAAYTIGVLDNVTPFSGSPKSGIGFGSLVDGVNGYSIYSSITGGKENATSGNVASYLTFNTRLSGVAQAEQMRITSAGLVGIGTTSPSSKLHVSSGTITLDGTGSPTAGKALCFTAAKLLGTCSDAPDASGNCTCAAP